MPAVVVSDFPDIVAVISGGISLLSLSDTVGVSVVVVDILPSTP